MENLNVTITNQMNIDTVIRKIINGVQYKSYSNVARYVYAMHTFDISLKLLRKKINKHLKEYDVYVNRGVMNKETAVADLLLNPEKYESGDTLKDNALKDSALAFRSLGFESALSTQRVDESGNMETLTASQVIANIEQFLINNKVNYRTLIQNTLNALKETETETPETETETPETETETPETETPETLTLLQIIEALPQLSKKELQNLAIHINALIDETTEKQKSTKKHEKAA